MLHSSLENSLDHSIVRRNRFLTMNYCSIRSTSPETSKHANSNALWLNRQMLSVDQIRGRMSAQTTRRLAFDLQRNNNKNESSTAKQASSNPGGIWMNGPAAASSDDTETNSDSAASFVQTKPISDSVLSRKSTQLRTMMVKAATRRVTFSHQQDNNNRRKAHWSDSSGASGSSSDDYEIVSDESDNRGLLNTSAVARGADAMVKNSLSRQTEIIDTSKLIEEGKVSTEYLEEPEIIEDQDRKMIDDYEKTFAYARRLRALLNMKFRELDKGTVDTNFLLIKAHEHPTQRMIDRWRNVDYGVSYNDQVKKQKLIEDYRTNAVKKKEKKGEESEPHYPDNIRFTVRFRKENSEKRWKDYLAYRQKQKKIAGKKAAGPVPKPNDKYVFAYQDIWSFCIAVYAKPWATVREIVDPVFARIGLDRRADFIFTIGCFQNDKRAGKAKILGVPNLPEELQMYQIASDLYKKNCTEIYVNDNRCDMFRIFPDYYNPKKSDGPPEKKDKKKKKGKGGKAVKNKSNIVDEARSPKSADTVEASAPASISRRSLSVVQEETSQSSLS